MPHRVPTALRLSAAERADLEGWARRRKTAQALALRARIVLQAAAGSSNTAIAAALGVSKHTVGKWRERFAKDRLEGLQDQPRSGAPRTVTDEQVAALLVRTLEATPGNATHWSTRSMAAACGLSAATVQRVWRVFGLKPHRTESFKLSSDPEFAAKVRDIVGLYLSPPDRALVLCVDERTEMQAIERTRPVLPMRPGRPERRTSDYVRHGTSSLFAALDVAVGRVIGRCYRRHRAAEFRAFLEAVDAAVPAEFDVHVVLDNASIHKAPSIRDWLLQRPRYHLHFTPTASSWLDQVERFFALLTARQLKRGVHRSVEELEAAVPAYVERHDAEPTPFRWAKSADEILARLASSCTRILAAHEAGLRRTSEAQY
ncbi:MAG TPA: IS630 family transposase [Geminicoccaceae bacterium]|nr:IS630 family transposase [Geminicoccaceae bacterium]